MKSDSAPRFDKMLQIRAPESLAEALDWAADQKLTSKSNYIRTALLDRLKIDGLDPSSKKAATVR
jgi:hypothetical protein